MVASPDAPPRVVADVRGRLPGRGASVHPTLDCLRRAVKRRAFGRALRRPDLVDVSAADLARQAADTYLSRAEGLLGAAHRTGAAVYGTDATREAIRAGRVALLLVASDAEGRRDEIASALERAGGRALAFGTKASLGSVFGRAEVGVVGVHAGSFVEPIRDAVTRATALSEAV